MRSSCTAAVRITLLALLGTGALGFPRLAAAQDPRSRLGVTYDGSSFSGSSAPAPWHELSLHWTRRTTAGSVTGRVNLAERFDHNGAQLEVDAYPRLGSGRYAFLNVGVADDAVFPTLRLSGELWQRLPASFEVSAGARLLRFSDDVLLWTGSLGHYTGNYWLAARPWLRFRDGSASASINLFARKYGRDRDDYVGLVLGAGSGISDLDRVDELDRLSSYKLEVDGRTPLPGPWVGRWTAGGEWEELTSTRSRTRLKISVGLERAF